MHAPYSPDFAPPHAHIKMLEQQMYQHARELEFEQAAKLRDQIRQHLKAIKTDSAM